MARTVIVQGVLAPDEQVVVSTRVAGHLQSLTVEPEALERIVEKGHSLAFGARFLKRVIDDLVKLPISEQWQNGHSFQVRSESEDVIVETVGPRLVTERPGRLAYGT